MDGNPCGWFEIYVQDMERAKAFYESVFGVQLAKLEGPGAEMWGFPMQQDRYGAGGAPVRMPGGKGRRPGGAGEVPHRPIRLHRARLRHRRQRDRPAFDAVGAAKHVMRDGLYWSRGVYPSSDTRRTVTGDAQPLIASRATVSGGTADIQIVGLRGKADLEGFHVT